MRSLPKEEETGFETGIGDSSKRQAHKSEVQQHTFHQQDGKPLPVLSWLLICAWSCLHNLPTCMCMLCGQSGTKCCLLRRSATQSKWFCLPDHKAGLAFHYLSAAERHRSKTGTFYQVLFLAAFAKVVQRSAGGLLQYSHLNQNLNMSVFGTEFFRIGRISHYHLFLQDRSINIHLP